MALQEQINKSYDQLQKTVATCVRRKPKKGTKRPKPRPLNGRIFPKGSLHRLALKYGAIRVAGEGEKDAYALIDRELFNIIENVLYDAVIYAKTSCRNSIREEDVARAIDRLGGSAIGLITERTRQRGVVNI